jgi:hypothetical protein
LAKEHYSLSGTCNFQKTPATGWRTMIRSNFGKYILINNLADIENLITKNKQKQKYHTVRRRV